VCAEPPLGPLPDVNLDSIHWLVAGGESGPSWRPMELAWVRQLRNKCRTAGVPFYFKQANGFYPGSNAVLDGRRYEEMPPLRSHPLPLFSQHK
jgi:protein gp37